MLLSPEQFAEMDALFDGKLIYPGYRTRRAEALPESADGNSRSGAGKKRRVGVHEAAVFIRLLRHKRRLASAAKRI